MLRGECRRCGRSRAVLGRGRRQEEATDHDAVLEHVEAVRVLSDRVALEDELAHSSPRRTFSRPALSAWK
jgi:hypothetical protein